MFTGSENHDITLNAAAALTERYRLSMSSGDRKGGYFSADALSKILTQQDCIGLRFYYGLDIDENQVMVLCGVYANENDIYEGNLAEASIPCPYQCGDDNPLNSD